MTDILHGLTIEASAEKVFDAIASREGLSRWWTSQVSGESRVGSVLVFHFEKSTTIFRMRVDALDGPRRVAWSCVGDHEEWKGTTVTFDLEPSEQATHVRFVHANWRSATGWVADCSYAWAHVLARLKSYAETGQAAPYFD